MPFRRPGFSGQPALLASMLATLLAACGGGGSDDPAAAAVTSPDPVVAAASAGGSGATTTSTGSSGTTGTTSTGSTTASNTDCGITDFQAQVLAAINAQRAAARSCGTKGNFAAAAPLVWNGQLAQAAAGHSADMAAQDYFDHVSADGRTFVNRIEATGYLWQRLAENIAANQLTVQEVMDGWMASDGHCANVMEPALVEVGVACAAGTASSQYRTYWTMDLGTPR